MNGVEILTSNEVVIEYAFNWSAFWISGSVSLGIFIILGIVLYKAYLTKLAEIIPTFLLGVFVSILSGIVFGSVLQTPTKYATEYKVIISDEVLMNEFNKKYEIMNQEGRIFTVREREEQNDIP